MKNSKIALYYRKNKALNSSKFLSKIQIVSNCLSKLVKNISYILIKLVITKENK